MNGKDSSTIPGAPGTTETKEEAAKRQEAETFFNDIMLEVKQHDLQNAVAMQEYLDRAKFWKWGKKEESIPVVPPPPIGSTASIGGALNENGYVEKKLKGGFVMERSTTAAPTEPKPAVGRNLHPWLFKKVNPDYVPLMSRWWVPWVAVGTIALIWTPDPWKLRTLYYADHQYAMGRQAVHKWYWRMTMDPADYETLVKQMEANVPKRKQIDAPDCPF